ncbi:MAG: dTDP-4-amino-4,6-dideoxygalactose transaminase [Cytophagales bacterium]|uniref:dTDP-4-amino-4,6-dideoxygalactose transaminase n=1 Tax=Cyclobacterium marinum TaxID=104 RepID=UPI0030DBD430|nr:dTDP-4-amino-4,6-dideoxygalactose transaminase [Cytophagales bacterium]|tara:strand:+ start:65263 stop:66393 length:1131 start_codon:yes stop_codon:yes gene_type:complete
MYQIPFNKPYATGNEWNYIQDASKKGKLASGGKYTLKCQSFFEKRYGFKKTFLTHSCTQALEMAALLMDLKPGDEVILPSYTYVSTANAFALRGCKVVFADSCRDYPGIDTGKLAHLITDKTKAIVAVHYGGIACDMEQLLAISQRYNLYLVEDAAAGIDGYYVSKDQSKRPLGSFGQFATFSFHETKNISCGEGGMLVINDSKFIAKANLVWNRGTNKKDFSSGKANKYEWQSLGSAFAPSEINAAWLWAQLEQIESIQSVRKIKWHWHHTHLPQILEKFDLEWMAVPKHAAQNFHLFYGLAKNLKHRDQVLNFFKRKKIMAVFHYQSLHTSPYYLSQYPRKIDLFQAEKYSECLIRFPLYNTLDTDKLNGLLSN